MSSTLRIHQRPDGATFSSSVGTTVITNAPMVAYNDFTLTASTYTFTVKDKNAVTLWQQTGVVIADGHIYGLPPITWIDSAASAGTVHLVV